MRRHKREDKHSLSESGDATTASPDVKKVEKLGKIGKLLDVSKLTPEELSENLLTIENYLKSNESSSLKPLLKDAIVKHLSKILKQHWGGPNAEKILLSTTGILLTVSGDVEAKKQFLKGGVINSLVFIISDTKNAALKTIAAKTLANLMEAGDKLIIKEVTKADGVQPLVEQLRLNDTKILAPTIKALNTLTLQHWISYSPLCMKLITLLLAKLSMSVTPKILEYISQLIIKLCGHVPFRDAFVSGNALNPLMEMLRLYEFKPLRKSALHALQRIGDKNKQVPRIVRLLNSKHNYLRKAAVHILSTTHILYHVESPTLCPEEGEELEEDESSEEGIKKPQSAATRQRFQKVLQTHSSAKEYRKLRHKLGKNVTPNEPPLQPTGTVMKPSKKLHSLSSSKKKRHGDLTLSESPAERERESREKERDKEKDKEGKTRKERRREKRQRRRKKRGEKVKEDRVDTKGKGKGKGEPKGRSENIDGKSKGKGKTQSINLSTGPLGGKEPKADILTASYGETTSNRNNASELTEKKKTRDSSTDSTTTSQTTTTSSSLSSNTDSFTQNKNKSEENDLNLQEAPARLQESNDRASTEKRGDNTGEEEKNADVGSKSPSPTKEAKRDNERDKSSERKKTRDSVNTDEANIVVKEEETHRSRSSDKGQVRLKNRSRSVGAPSTKTRTGLRTKTRSVSGSASMNRFIPASLATSEPTVKTSSNISETLETTAKSSLTAAASAHPVIFDTANTPAFTQTSTQTTSLDETRTSTSPINQSTTTTTPPTTLQTHKTSSRSLTDIISDGEDVETEEAFNEPPPTQTPAIPSVHPLLFITKLGLGQVDGEDLLSCTDELFYNTMPLIVSHIRSLTELLNSHLEEEKSIPKSMTSLLINQYDEKPIQKRYYVTKWDSIVNAFLHRVHSTPYFGQYLSWLEETGNGLTLGRARKPHEKYWIKIVYISRRRKISAQIFRMLSDQLKNGDYKEGDKIDLTDLGMVLDPILPSAYTADEEGSLVKSITVNKVFPSKARPVLLNLVHQSPTIPDTKIILKLGDMTKDLLSQTAFYVFNLLWQNGPFRVHDRPKVYRYKVFPLLGATKNFPSLSCIQFVENTRSTEEFTWSILQTLSVKELNTFLRTASGAYIAGWILGVRDRHRDNMLVYNNSVFFHIDFEHILDQKTRINDAPRITIHKGMKMYLKKRSAWNEFINRCGETFAVIQTHSGLITRLCSDLFEPVAGGKEPVRKYFTSSLMLFLPFDRSEILMKDHIKQGTSGLRILIKDTLHTAGQKQAQQALAGSLPSIPSTRELKRDRMVSFYDSAPAEAFLPRRGGGSGGTSPVASGESGGKLSAELDWNKEVKRKSRSEKEREKLEREESGIGSEASLYRRHNRSRSGSFGSGGIVKPSASPRGATGSSTTDTLQIGSILRPRSGSFGGTIASIREYGEKSRAGEDTSSSEEETFVTKKKLKALLRSLLENEGVLESVVQRSGSTNTSPIQEREGGWEEMLEALGNRVRKFSKDGTQGRNTSSSSAPNLTSMPNSSPPIVTSKTTSKISAAQTITTTATIVTPITPTVTTTASPDAGIHRSSSLPAIGSFVGTAAPSRTSSVRTMDGNRKESPLRRRTADKKRRKTFCSETRQTLSYRDGEQ